MKYDILDTKALDGAQVELLAYPDLEGSTTATSAERLFFLRQAGVRPKTVRIRLNKGKCRLEPGALYHMQGNLEFKTSTGGGFGKALFRKATSGESFFVNELVGTGEIILEPTWGHFVMIEIGANEPDLIVEKGMFYAGIGNLDIAGTIVKNAATAFLGGEGLIQTKISGSGVVVLVSPVPWSEIEMFDITKNGKVSVDGKFALMRTADVTFKVEKSSKSWVATSVSGEGLLQTFSGTGKVWIAPTLAVYEGLEQPMSGVLGSVRSDQSG